MSGRRFLMICHGDPFDVAHLLEQAGIAVERLTYTPAKVDEVDKVGVAFDVMPEMLAAAVLGGWARLCFGAALSIHLGQNEWATYALGKGQYAAETGEWFLARGTGISVPWSEIPAEVRPALLVAFHQAKTWCDGEVGSTRPWGRSA